MLRAMYKTRETFVGIKMKNTPIVLATFVLSLLATSCSLLMPSPAKQFYEKYQTNEQRKNAILKYAPQEQWEIYEYGLNKIEPPLVQMSEYVAFGGNVNFNYIINYLKETRDSKEYADASFVFIHMQKNKIINICQSSEGMGEINALSSHIDDAYWKSIYDKQIAKMCTTYSY